MIRNSIRLKSELLDFIVTDALSIFLKYGMVNALKQSPAPKQVPHF
jgi:hypothetical protein